VAVDTNEDYVPKLLKLFKVRNQSFKLVWWGFCGFSFW
jgi:hypothetical protein